MAGSKRGGLAGMRRTGLALTGLLAVGLAVLSGTAFASSGSSSATTTPSSHPQPDNNSSPSSAGPRISSRSSEATTEEGSTTPIRHTMPSCGRPSTPRTPSMRRRRPGTWRRASPLPTWSRWRWTRQRHAHAGTVRPGRAGSAAPAASNFDPQVGASLAAHARVCVSGAVSRTRAGRALPSISPADRDR